MQLDNWFVVLNSKDNVAICTKGVPSKTIGDRFALKDIPKGEYLFQYGYPFAKSLGIVKGDLITLENTENEIPHSIDKAFVTPPVTKLIEKYKNKTFFGYKRANNQVGTRNYIAVIPTSMCASEVANQVARAFDTEEFFKTYQNIDGVVSLAHTEGCGCGAGMQIDRTMNTLKNFALHANVHSVLFIDLGCEQTNYNVMHKYLHKNGNASKKIEWITIQENGGIEETIQKSKEIIKSFLNDANSCYREEVPVSYLVYGTECGGSDRFSGITANPLIGKVADHIIYGGGKAILSEVPEMLGVYDMFFDRFASMEVAGKFQKAVNWYMDIAQKLDVNISNNVVPANVQGGLINSYIKSLGAVMKGGSTRIEDVLEYGESILKNGLSIMQGPGNDLESVTGLTASGANIICFSTGYGTVTGSAITPVIKISSNTNTFSKLSKDMDFDAGTILTDANIDQLSEELFDKVIKVASGEKSWSEKWKQRQFQIWTAGKLTL